MRQTMYMMMAAIPAVTQKVATVVPMILPAFLTESMLAMAEQMEQKTIGTTTQNIRFVKMVPSQARFPACSGKNQPNRQPAAIPASMLVIKP